MKFILIKESYNSIQNNVTLKTLLKKKIVFRPIQHRKIAETLHKPYIETL